MPEPLTEDQARTMLATTQRDIEDVLRRRAEHESSIADTDDELVTLRRRERDLTIFLTPERGGVPRVIRKS